MKKIILILIIPVILFIVGCKRELEYEFLTHGDTLYRLEKRSGKISVVENSKIITLEEQTIDITVLSKTKTWSDISPPWVKYSRPKSNTVKLSLKTRWRDGNLYFIFTATGFYKKSKYSFLYKESYPVVEYFSLKLYDSNDFIIIEKQITSDEMYRLFDEQGKYLGIEINSSIPCTAETYLSIEDWSCDWELL
jgi:hypothetical protein